MKTAYASMIMVATWLVAGDVRADEEMFDYVVQPGDKCDVIAGRLYGNAARVDLIHGPNPQLGPPPHNLKAGSVLRLRRIAGTSTLPDAQISHVRNRVDAFTPTQHAGKPDEPLFRGHRVSTYEGSGAEVRFTSNAVIQLGEKTLVVILGNARGSVSKTADTTLVNGSMRSRLGSLAGQPANVAVATPSGHRVDLSSGEAQVTVDPKQTTRVAIYKGAGSFSAQGQTVKVPEGFGSKAQKDKPPTPPRPLPPSPKWITALPAVVFAAAPVDVTGQFGPGTGPGPKAAKWHVQISRDDAFNDLVVDATVALDVTKVEARGLVAGAYQARVSAIDDDQFEGPFGTTSVVFVSPMAIAVVSAGQDATLDMPAGLFCGIDGAPLAVTSGPIPFKRGPERRLRCAANGAGEGASDTVIPAQRIGPLAVVANVEAVGPGEARLVLTITDPTKAPVTGSKIVAQATSGVTVSDLKPGTAPGTYVATVRWPASATSFRLQLTVNGVDSAETAAIALPASEPQPPPPSEPGPLEASLLAGLSIPSNQLSVGPSLGVELAGRWQFRSLSLAIGFRPTWEHHSFDSSAACNAGPSPVPRLCPAPYTYSLNDDLFSFAFPITLRLGAPTERWLPYAGIAPALIVDRSESVYHYGQALESAAVTKGLFGFSGFLGIEARVSERGRFFFEAGYRATPELSGGAGTFTRNAWLLNLGYRGGI